MPSHPARKLLAAVTTAALLAPLAPSADAAPARCPLDPVRVEMTATLAAHGAAGHVEITATGSPYGIAVDSEGRTVSDLTVVVRRLPPRADAGYVVWAATPDLDRVAKLGVVPGEEPVGAVVTGEVAWNQFLVFVSAEADPAVERWEGPIVLTAMSPSGKLHTMAGHGIFEAYSYLC